MEAKIKKSCGTCLSMKKEEKDSVIWCYTCKEGLCVDCHGFHQYLFVLKSHNLCPVEDLELIPEIALSCDDICSEHSRKFDIYCSFHQVPGCIKCGTSYHKSCDDVLPLDEVIKNSKSSVALSRVEEGLDGLESKIEHIIEVKKRDMSRILDKVKDIKENAMQLKESVVTKFDDLLEKLNEKSAQVKSEFDSTTAVVMDKLNSKMKLVRDKKMQTAQLKENASNLQTFLCTKKLEEFVTTEENEIALSLENSQFDGIDIAFEVDKNIDLLLSLNEIGNIQTRVKKLELSECSSTSPQRTIEEKNTATGIEDIRLKKKIEISFPGSKTSTCVTSCVILPNGVMVFTDFSDNNRLMVFDRYGSFLRNISTKVPPYDIAIINDSEVTVTLTRAKKVVLINMGSDTETTDKEYNTKGQCYGIAKYIDRLYIAVKEFGIQVIDMFGNTISLIPVSCKAIRVHKNIYTMISGPVLRCLDLSGTEIWEHKIDNSTCLRSILVYPNSHVFVSESMSDCLYAVSSDGKNRKRIFSSSDGLICPSGLFHDNRNQELLFCTKRQSAAVLYSIV